MSRLPISEDDVLARVLDEARWAGWLVAHFRPARVRRGGRETYETPVAADGRGFPDLVLVHAKRGLLAFVELKGSRGRPSPEQLKWLDALKSATADQHAVRAAIVGPRGLDAFCAWLRGERGA